MLLIILCKMLFLTKTFPGFCDSHISIFVLKCFYCVLKLKVSLNSAQLLLQLIYVAKIFLVSFLCE